MGISESAHERTTTRKRGGFRRLLVRTMLACIAVLVVAVMAAFWPGADPAYEADMSHDTGKRRTIATQETPLHMHKWFYCWDEIPGHEPGMRGIGQYSNIRPEDYVGPERCGKCHQKNYQKWSQHPHRWMNAAATSTTVKGRFDGSEIQLRGGTIRMYQKNDHFWMYAKRHQFERLFRVTHTIGSRFLQYYIGVLEQGELIRVPGLVTPHGPAVPHDTKVVLPVGYNLRKQQWVPATQVFASDDSDDTSDPYEGFLPIRYYQQCAYCHTVVPQGYRTLWDSHSADLNKPAFHFETLPFLRETLATMADGLVPEPPLTRESLYGVIRRVVDSYGPERAVTLGISCEGCHYGGKAHAESDGGKVLPPFFPTSPHIAHSEEVKSDGRTRANANLACAQCHSTPTRILPSGMRRRNSAEYRDAISGSCYSQLACIDCHEPHTAIGPVWSKTPDQDDASCSRCHQQYSTIESIQQHTHHPPGTEGARCMNCHMPKVTEGLLDIVRSHQITIPSSSRIIEAGGTNACNICHMDQSIDWTLGHLNDWYGAVFDQTSLNGNYDDKQLAAGLLWLRDIRPEIRLIALGAAKRSKAEWLAPEVARQLDSRYVTHRQHAQDALEQILGTDLDRLGYRFWMTPKERGTVLGEIHHIVRGHIESGTDGRHSLPVE